MNKVQLIERLNEELDVYSNALINCQKELDTVVESEELVLRSFYQVQDDEKHDELRIQASELYKRKSECNSDIITLNKYIYDLNERIRLLSKY